MIEITGNHSINLRSISLRGNPSLPPIETQLSEDANVFGSFFISLTTGLCRCLLEYDAKKMYTSCNTRSTLAPTHNEEHIDPAFQPLTKRNCDHDVVDPHSNIILTSY